ncbi:hypothetical protein Tco_0096821 [Tanacetum coccineum]
MKKSYNDRTSIDLGDDWAWVSLGPERHQVAAAGAPAVTEDAPAINKVIMEYLVNISKRRAFLCLNEDILKINDSDYQYAVSIKEDMAYPFLHSPKYHKGNKLNTSYPEKTNTLNDQNTWDLLEKEFIWKYCSPFKTAKKLEEIRNFKQEMYETLYQAWERFQQIGGKFRDRFDLLWFCWISFDYHVTLGFGSIAGGLDHVNPVIRLPLEHGISKVIRLVLGIVGINHYDLVALPL